MSRKAFWGISHDDDDDKDDDFDIWSFIVMACFVETSLKRPSELSSRGLHVHPRGRKVGYVRSRSNRHICNDDLAELSSAGLHTHPAGRKIVSFHLVDNSLAFAMVYVLMEGRGIAMVLVECELCGGHELRKQNGEYVCLSCNTRYTLEEARKLVKKEQKVAPSPKEIVPEAKEKALLEDYPELMRAEHVAHVMGVSKQAVYRMSREEQIPSVVIGSRIFFPRQRFLEFLEYLESQKRQSNDRS